MEKFCKNYPWGSYHVDCSSDYSTWKSNFIARFLDCYFATADSYYSKFRKEAILSKDSGSDYEGESCLTSQLSTDLVFLKLTDFKVVSKRHDDAEREKSISSMKALDEEESLYLKELSSLKVRLECLIGEINTL